jgi:exonuclease SbcC
MRPVRLDMHGFAAFREPTVVDFVGAEYFALVGPTGSGKSTVIDAMTFALYGSVPRWDNKGIVALALSPTANRGTVGLRFDVGERHYLVVRELRRSAAGAVTVRNARLERVHDPDDPERNEPLAADGAVTKEVERLLGLPFEQFCVCVVLPQGDFARFLHAKPADRQKTLTELLGLGVYTVMAQRAGTEAKAAAQRAEVFAEQLTGYADATEENAAAAAAREAALVALAERVQRALPALAEADAEVAEAQREEGELAGQRAVLAAVAAPDGLAELAASADRSRRASTEARERLTAAETADSEARDGRAEAPDREPLLALRRDHAELTGLTERLPELTGAATRTRAASGAAAGRVAEAEVAREAARTRRDAAATDRDGLAAEAERLAAERSALAAVTLPAGLADLDAGRRAAGSRLVDARRELADADAADRSAREALGADPGTAAGLETLLQARRDHAALAAAEDDRRSRQAEHREAAARAGTADAALAAAECELAGAQAALRERTRTDAVAVLRGGLSEHEPCPVCAQPVHRLPPPVEAAGVTAAEHVEREARGGRDRAVAAQQVDAHTERTAAAALAVADREVQRLRTALAGAPGGADGAARVVELLAERDHLTKAAQHADERARRARAEGDAAAEAAERVTRALSRENARLRAVRDPLVAYGAPTSDTDQDTGDDTDRDTDGEPPDPLTAWRELAGWAGRAAAARTARLDTVRDELGRAERDRRDAQSALAEAETELAGRREAATAAVRAEQDAEGELARARRRTDELTAALRDAPPDAELVRRLAELDALDRAAAAAGREVRDARDGLGRAERVAQQVAGRVDEGWRELDTARDPLVVLGAPAPAGRGAGAALATAWTALAGWARDAATERDRRLEEVRRRAERAGRERATAEAALRAELAGYGVHPPDGRPLASAAAPSVSEAVARAHAAVERVAERRETAAALERDRSAAEESGQVARMLATLLRSDAFPRWLVASALDALVADASVRLAELSAGQFELTHADGEFLVVDHADADAHRPVKTLSGGETFQASLALALALSEQLATLASAGAARLDSIFLDEGFGTLDEANLETVAATLENLAAQGDRMVGVITHVPALAERVPVRFEVSRDQRTSSIVREGP